MTKFELLEQFYRGKRVLVTGHTGFKGSWLCSMLLLLGAEVYGYALEAPTEPSLYEILQLEKCMHSEIGDVRDYEKLKQYVDTVQPDVVLHLAAQPIVRTSYIYPRETFETNVMGTVNLLEAVRNYNRTHPVPVSSLLNVTTDKVYENPEQADHAFTEGEKLDGYDPYSNSKSCSELVTHSYQRSFFNASVSPDGAVTSIATARAGNVIGGGDFAKDRILPDCVRDTMAGETIHVRNPYSTRPYQHVLEPLYVYLRIAMTRLEKGHASGADNCYNVGPDEEDALTTGALADLFVKYWGDAASWQSDAEANAPHEASYLRLNTDRLKQTFGWHPRWHAAEAVQETVSWYRAWAAHADMKNVTETQIRTFLADQAEKSTE